MRYFLVSYVADGGSFGEMSIINTLGKFLSRDYFRKEVEKLGYKTPVILNIFEFKNKEDYEGFYNKE